jgi:hypothetical protein
MALWIRIRIELNLWIRIRIRIESIRIHNPDYKTEQLYTQVIENSQKEYVRIFKSR